MRRIRRGAGPIGSNAAIGYQMRVRSRFGPLMVTVTHDGLAALRQEGMLSPAGYVISENRALIEAIALRKFEAAEFDENGFLVIGERDICA